MSQDNKKPPTVADIFINFGRVLLFLYGLMLSFAGCAGYPRDTLESINDQLVSISGLLLIIIAIITKPPAPSPPAR